jgi:hypothetical protein
LRFRPLKARVALRLDPFDGDRFAGRIDLSPQAGHVQQPRLLVDFERDGAVRQAAVTSYSATRNGRPSETPVIQAASTSAEVDDRRHGDDCRGKVDTDHRQPRIEAMADQPGAEADGQHDSILRHRQETGIGARQADGAPDHGDAPQLVAEGRERKPAPQRADPSVAQGVGEGMGLGVRRRRSG